MIFQTKSSNIKVPLPLFIPVYRPDYSFELFSGESYAYGLSAVMVNSFLLYRERDLRTAFEKGHTLREHIGGFKGMLCTDSGAFQQLGGRKVDIDPIEIVRFQNIIKTDIAAPLDLITPPETSYDETYQRMVISQYRIEEALQISDYSDLAGIQQGGGFFSFRQRHIRQLAKLRLNYYGIGSMVPFFNKNHDLSFTCSVINDARIVIGPGTPMHVYGAGDPLDMAFMFYAGANIFDSSSYAHYAERGYYMTPYGAINKRVACEQLGFNCSCPVCAGHDMSEIFGKESGEALRKKHNLFLILDTVRALREHSEKGQIQEYVSAVYDKHVGNPDLFPGSMLARSWDKYLKGEISENATEQRSSVSVFIQNSGGTEKMDIITELTALEKEVVELLANESAGTYKMDYALILKLLAEELLLPKNAGFRTRLNSVNTLRDVQRLSEYKAFRKNVRGNLYQKLRQYKTSSSSINEILTRLIESEGNEVPLLINQLLEEHISTRERLPHKDEFIEYMSSDIKPGSILIDIGCGFNPLLFPTEFFERLSCYIAVDKDSEATEIVRVFAQKCNIPNLRAFTWDISSGVAALNELTGLDHYDVAVLLKVVPVVNRADQTHNNDKHALPVLGSFPASRFLATVSRESMTKYESIEKRETATLRQFVHTYGFNIESEFSCGSEFGYYLSKEEESCYENL